VGEQLLDTIRTQDRLQDQFGAAVCELGQAMGQQHRSAAAKFQIGIRRTAVKVFGEFEQVLISLQFWTYVGFSTSCNSTNFQLVRSSGLAFANDFRVRLE